MRSRLNQWPQYPDARGWIGIALFLLTVMLLWMIKSDPTLRQDEFFKTIATLIIGTGFVGGLVAWAFAATKQGGELAERSASMAERATGMQPSPPDVAMAARQTANAAQEEAERIGDGSQEWPIGEEQR